MSLWLQTNPVSAGRICRLLWNATVFYHGISKDGTRSEKKEEIS
jgi:hypothetical protein